MRVAVNLNFTDGELRRYAADVGRRWILTAIHEGIGHLSVAKIDPRLMSVLSDAFKSAAKPAGDDFGEVWPPKSSPMPSPPMPNQCVDLPATLFSDEGWACHLCMTHNGAHRTVCRKKECGHVRCDRVNADSAVDAEFPEPT